MHESNPISLHNYTYSCFVGVFGVVYRAKFDHPDGSVCDVTMKSLEGTRMISRNTCAFFNSQISPNNFTTADAHGKRQILIEGLRMSNFAHDHILPLIGIAFDSCFNPYIITPFMHNGSLLAYLRNTTNVLKKFILTYC